MDAEECIRTRRSYPRLVEPAPDAEEIETLLGAAVTAPDHGSLQPWRFVVIRDDARHRLGAVFADAQRSREPAVDPGVLEKTAAKPLRAPVIIAVIATPIGPDEAWNGKDIPAWEQVAAVAAATQNLCLAAHARGWATMWRTGWYGDAPQVRAALGMAADDTVVGWVYLGTPVTGATLPPRRPTPVAERTTTWAG